MLPTSAFSVRRLPLLKPRIGLPENVPNSYLEKRSKSEPPRYETPRWSLRNPEKYWSLEIDNEYFQYCFCLGSYSVVAGSPQGSHRRRRKYPPVATALNPDTFPTSLSSAPSVNVSTGTTKVGPVSLSLW